MFTTQSVPPYILYDDLSKPVTFLLQALTAYGGLSSQGYCYGEMNDFCDESILNTQTLRERHR